MTIEQESSLREEVCEVGRRLWQRQLVAAFDGNFSVRLGHSRVLCTPTGMSKGFLNPNDLVIINDEGHVIDGQREPSSEIKMHLAIYKARPDITSVVHAHPPYATAFAVAGQTVPAGVMPEIDFMLGTVALLPYSKPGTSELADGFTGPALNGANVFLLSNHGATCAGTSLQEAWFRMESLEQCCQVLSLAKNLGGWRNLEQ